MTSRVGQQFGNYSLLKLLGAGGFAEVYLGEHVYLNTQAAITTVRIWPGFLRHFSLRDCADRASDENRHNPSKLS